MYGYISTYVFGHVTSRGPLCDVVGTCCIHIYNGFKFIWIRFEDWGCVEFFMLKMLCWLMIELRPLCGDKWLKQIYASLNHRKKDESRGHLADSSKAWSKPGAFNCVWSNWHLVVFFSGFDPLKAFDDDLYAVPDVEEIKRIKRFEGMKISRQRDEGRRSPRRVRLCGQLNWRFFTNGWCHNFTACWEDGKLYKHIKMCAWWELLKSVKRFFLLCFWLKIILFLDDGHAQIAITASAQGWPALPPTWTSSHAQGHVRQGR